MFSEYLRREWMVVETGNADAVRAFAERQGTIVTKEPVGQAGTGVHRYHAAEIEDWDAFHRGLLTRGELLIEEVIVQHADLAAVCPGTVNTTRVTAFFDGEQTHILAVAQKFGRGAVSDQMTYGGFYTMLDDDGHSVGAGYDSHGHIHEFHPESGVRIADFQLPLMDEVVAFVDQVARVVPQIQYVGWDIVVTPDGRCSSRATGRPGCTRTSRAQPASAPGTRRATAPRSASSSTLRQAQRPGSSQQPVPELVEGRD